mmetsp:Transcript_84952/g.245640  ORF Transcript_84952/g.245640 Transcript_84952/m.245640 type:complete len:236 (-) Transcript_84952:15-722(-)
MHQGDVPRPLQGRSGQGRAVHEAVPVQRRANSGDRLLPGIRRRPARKEDVALCRELTVVPPEQREKSDVGEEGNKASAEAAGKAVDANGRRSAVNGAGRPSFVDLQGPHDEVCGLRALHDPPLLLDRLLAQAMQPSEQGQLRHLAGRPCHRPCHLRAAAAGRRALHQRAVHGLPAARACPAHRRARRGRAGWGSHGVKDVRAPQGGRRCISVRAAGALAEMRARAHPSARGAPGP